MSMSRLAVILMAIILSGIARGAPDRYAVNVPNGLSFADFRGYESWQYVAPSQTESGLKIIAANDAMMTAYKAGVPGNGHPFPDGSRIAKIEWSRQANPISQYPV